MVMDSSLEHLVCMHAAQLVPHPPSPKHATLAGPSRDVCPACGAYAHDISHHGDHIFILRLSHVAHPYFYYVQYCVSHIIELHLPCKVYISEQKEVGKCAACEQGIQGTRKITILLKHVSVMCCDRELDKLDKILHLLLTFPMLMGTPLDSSSVIVHD